MKYEQLVSQVLKDDCFYRLTGLNRSTFIEMVGVLKLAEKSQKALGGKRNILTIEDRLLITLEYWREYRTYFHIGKSVGISESSAYRNIKWCEDTLVKSKMFNLRGKKALCSKDFVFDTVLIDASETPIQRPKKAKKLLFGQKEASHTQNAARC